MLKCTWCKKEVYATINDKCSDCYYSWEGLPLIDKFYLIMAGVLLIMTTILIMIIWTINS